MENKEVILKSWDQIVYFCPHLSPLLPFQIILLSEGRVVQVWAHLSSVADDWPCQKGRQPSGLQCQRNWQRINRYQKAVLSYNHSVYSLSIGLYPPIPTSSPLRGDVKHRDVKRKSLSEKCLINKSYLCQRTLEHNWKTFISIIACSERVIQPQLLSKGCFRLQSEKVVQSWLNHLKKWSKRAQTDWPTVRFTAGPPFLKK